MTPNRACCKFEFHVKTLTPRLWNIFEAIRSDVAKRHKNVTFFSFVNFVAFGRLKKLRNYKKRIIHDDSNNYDCQAENLMIMF